MTEERDGLIITEKATFSMVAGEAITIVESLTKIYLHLYILLARLKTIKNRISLQQLLSLRRLKTMKTILQYYLISEIVTVLTII